jgi:ATP phosphoribosyltransferase
MSEALILAVPSKGRLMEQASAYFGAAGCALSKTGAARGYQGALAGFPDVEVQFVSSSQIVDLLRHGRAHLGITGEDLVREAIPDADQRVEFVHPLGFGRADVVVAAPACWLDVTRMADLEEMAIEFRRQHGYRLRVATKYMNLARRFFVEKGIASYRIVESLGATEGAPAAGLAELIVDITTSGATLHANGLRVLEDGVILRSQANLIAARGADWTVATRAIEARLAQRLVRAAGA